MTMKEKISCSLDGNLIEIMDKIISQQPIVKTRSACIEMALIFLYGTLFSDIKDCSVGFNTELFNELYELRCDLNAQKESKN